MNVLFATSEVQPLVRTGGLAEVSIGLPRSLRALGEDVRVVMPAYAPAIKATTGLAEATRLKLTGVARPVRVLVGVIPSAGVPIYLIDYPSYFERGGGPYANSDGDEWADNAQRFALFCRAVTAIATGEANLDWKVDLVHCNDWQTGLVPALLAANDTRPATLFTIHNLAAQGLFSWEVFHNLRLPRRLWTRHGLEHYGNFSFIKGGLAFADRLNTVSPTYAREVQTDVLGCGLESVLRRHSERLTGILNGVDYEVWNPTTDPYLTAGYDATSLETKVQNKLAVQRRLDLDESAQKTLLIHAGRLLHRRGSDQLLELVPRLQMLDAQLVVMGQGERLLGDALSHAARRNPGRMATIIGNDEAQLHLLEAGADMFLIPSRFEPCGLDQLHSLRYGTIPVAHRTGGLTDTIEDVGSVAVPASGATGFCYEGSLAMDLVTCVERAIRLSRDNPEQWQLVQRNGMARDFGWTRSATRYQALYQEAVQDHAFDRNGGRTPSM
jgi:starch synthase